VLALSGGVGGAKLALGLARVLPAETLTIAANTADDFEHLGLYIAPDLDTVMYTLAGTADRQRGWGLAEETWRCMEALEVLGGETWFRLGDRDLATHLRRSQLLRDGQTLSEATAILCRSLGIETRLLPMSDDRVRTLVMTAAGELDFQHYFVRERCAPTVQGFRYEGIDSARPQPEVVELLGSESLAAVVICPSNPFVSVDPILGLPGMRAALTGCGAPVIAISPIVGGAALKGPAAKMLAELGHPVSAISVASHYAGVVDIFVLDQRDATLASDVVAMGMDVRTAPTVMNTLADREQLARAVLDMAGMAGAPL
jgi:LPPG:FO 2-phospho-L-lactate transferase